MWICWAPASVIACWVELSVLSCSHRWRRAEGLHATVNSSQVLWCDELTGIRGAVAREYSSTRSDIPVTLTETWTEKIAFSKTDELKLEII